MKDDKQNDLKIINLTSVSCTIELQNNNPFYSLYTFDVYVNSILVHQNKNTNVFTVFNLYPNTFYNVTIINNINKKEMSCAFTTLKASKIITINLDMCNKDDCAKDIQKVIDNAKKGTLIIIKKGIYNTTPIFLKSNITIELKKDAILLGNIDRNNYPVLRNETGKQVLGSWEGEAKDNFASLITGINVENVNIVGEGTIDGNAQNSDWWNNHRVIRIACRPHDIFLNNCKNINIIGLTIKNSPSWTIHPFYSKQLMFCNLNIMAPSDSPNTDGCNPESCSDVLIIGNVFTVGDDCIALKSGKIEMVKEHYQPCNKIIITNCLMQKGHGAVVFGSEMSSGITDVKVSKCVFKGTDRGLRIKTRRGRGNKAIINNVDFDNILMDEVKNPLVINMFYFCDPDGKTDYVQSKEKKDIDDRTPHLGKFHFKNMICHNTKISAGFFYGLPEAPIEEIKLENIKVDYQKNENFETPAMMLGVEKVNCLGFYFNNVDRIVIKNVQLNGQSSEEFILHNNKIFIKE